MKKLSILTLLILLFVNSQLYSNEIKLKDFETKKAENEK